MKNELLLDAFRLVWRGLILAIVREISFGELSLLFVYFGVQHMATWNLMGNLAQSLVGNACLQALASFSPEGGWLYDPACWTGCCSQI